MKPAGTFAIVSGRAARREFVANFVRTHSTLHLAWTATTEASAAANCRSSPPSVILLDADDPDVDVVTATRAFANACNVPIVLLSDEQQARDSEIYAAMSEGALCALAWPSDKGPSAGQSLLARLGRLANLGSATMSDARASVSNRVPSVSRRAPIVALGASTGGPAAVLRILTGLPRDLAASLVLVQHVDESFADSLSSWLHSASGFPVALAQEGMAPAVGSLAVAATHDHLVMNASGTFAYTREPRQSVHKPSIDVFFESLADHGGARSLAILLTGMGKDGARGLMRLRSAGWATIAQDEGSSVVFGMPRAAAQIGAAGRVLAIDQIAGAITAHVNGR
jgi:chemotaxis response regulator CheB